MKDSEVILLSAIRYALGRSTYIVGLTVDYVMRQDLSGTCKALVIIDIKNCRDYGMDIDKDEWMRLLDFLEKR